MLVNEVCKKTGLTKKAIEYYQLKGLISPIISERGYRAFSDTDLSSLKEIALYRKLGLNINEIKEIINSDDKRRVLLQIKQNKENQMNVAISRVSLIGELIEGRKLVDIQNDLELLEIQSTIKEKLLKLFPGYFGRFFSFHFGQFLNEVIDSEEHKMLFDRIVVFLDDMEPIVISEEMQNFIDQYDQSFDAYWELNKDTIIEYAKFRNSKEYKNSVIPKMVELFRAFNESSGYYDVFIPTMRQLSPSYDSYYKKMLNANEKMNEKLLNLEL